MLSFSVEFTQPKGINKRRHNQIMRRVNRLAGTRYKSDMLPKKFEKRSVTAAQKEYGDAFHHRTKSYLIKKAKEKGHAIPLVFSGRMKAYVRSNSKVTATASRGRIYIKNYFPMKEEMRDELEAVGDSDIEQMTSRMERDYTILMNRG